MKMGEGQRCKSGRRLRGESESVCVCELRRAWEKTLEDMGGRGGGGWIHGVQSERGADEDGGRAVFNQNVFQLILQLGHCSLALAHTRDDIASSAMRVINIMMTDWQSCGTASAR